jgi:uncharacterized membrane protein YqgA involved in biofilm formation
VHLPLGTLLNIATVIAGSGAGLLLHRSFPERFRRILLTAGGLATLTLGAQMALKTSNPLVLIGSLYVGALAGEALGIEAWLARVGEKLRAVGVESARPKNCDSEVSSSIAGRAGATPTSDFTQGLVTAFLIFCVGPMTLVGALNEGISGDHSLLYVKSVLDLATSFALATSFGSGVLASVVPLALFQLVITTVGMLIGKSITDDITTELTAVGGTLIIGLGLNLLEISKLRVANLLPALLVVILVMLLVARL